jgi:hypothetical protein
VLGLVNVVSPAHRRLDLRWILARDARGHVQGIIVVGDANLELVSRHAALDGIFLNEVDERRDACPRGIAKVAIDVDRARRYADRRCLLLGTLRSRRVRRAGLRVE